MQIMYKFMENLENKINNFIQDKEYDKAVSELNNLLQKHSDVTKCLIKRGDLYYLQHKYSDALNDYNKVLKIESENKLISAKAEMITEILRYEAIDIFASTNLNNDPWL